MKLHLACGDVYLDGWINIDAISNYATLASEDSVLVDDVKTDIHNYYRGKYIGHRGQIVVDEFMDLLDIPYRFENDSIDEILIIGAFEHFSKDEGISLLKEWHRILKPDGKLIIDVPDMVKTMRLITINPEWTMRLMYGSQRDMYSYHKWGYTPEYLEFICKGIGFKSAKQIELIEHAYPMFTMEMIK